MSSTAQQLPTPAHYFLDTLRHAIGQGEHRLVEPRYIRGTCREHPERAEHINQLSPDVDAIRRDLKRLPTSTAAYLAAIVELYNREAGAELLAALRIKGPGHLITTLKGRQRDMYLRLLSHYRGW